MNEKINKKIDLLLELVITKKKEFYEKNDISLQKSREKTQTHISKIFILLQQQCNKLIEY